MSASPRPPTELWHSLPEILAFLDHDDELTPNALARVVEVLNKDANIDVLYTDQDKIDENGRTYEKYLKPDWSPRHLCEAMYVGHLLVVRRALFHSIGGLEFEI